jgi:glycosyltransferase involved in cell wall biosynthesis
MLRHQTETVSAAEMQKRRDAMSAQWGRGAASNQQPASDRNSDHGSEGLGVDSQQRRQTIPVVEPAPAISIIVPAFNEEKLLAASLRAVKSAAAQSFGEAGLGWELIVCDNNSTDRTAEIAREEGAEVVFEAINQIGRARNTGAAAASGAWLLFIDADSQPSSELLADAARLTLGPDVLLAGATMRPDEGGVVFRLCCGVWNQVSRLRRLVAGSFILVRADAFREVGGFDLKFFAGEEIDLALRLQKIVGRRDGRKTVVLHRHPILTSARKLKLYGTREILRFLIRSVFRPRKTVADREACALWYDGRR